MQRRARIAPSFMLGRARAARTVGDTEVHSIQHQEAPAVESELVVRAGHAQPPNQRIAPHREIVIAEDVALRRGETAVNCEDRVQVCGTRIDQIAQLNRKGQVFAGIQGIHRLLQLAGRLAVLALTCGRLVAILYVGEYSERETRRRRLAAP